MLHSTYHHKETNEDPKTSAVFENLMLLPDNVFWHLLRQSCFSNTDIPITSGRLVSYDFWAHPTNPVECCADANPKTMLPNDT